MQTPRSTMGGRVTENFSTQQFIFPVWGTFLNTRFIYPTVYLIFPLVQRCVLKSTHPKNEFSITIMTHSLSSQSPQSSNKFLKPVITSSCNVILWAAALSAFVGPSSNVTYSVRLPHQTLKLFSLSSAVYPLPCAYCHMTFVYLTCLLLVILFYGGNNRIHPASPTHPPGLCLSWAQQELTLSSLLCS